MARSSNYDAQLNNWQWYLSSAARLGRDTQGTQLGHSTCFLHASRFSTITSTSLCGQLPRSCARLLFIVISVYLLEYSCRDKPYWKFWEAYKRSRFFEKMTTKSWSWEAKPPTERLLEVLKSIGSGACAQMHEDIAAHSLSGCFGPSFPARR